ncbi:MAG: thioredoxin-dependent thiol peroxidase [Microscillaceae bacterium]|jgi:peroxiredoxin Q/BCP|nr:thioredoxin-dependent thiol peroxidase [Microscillaceae bacterium]
MNLKTGDQAPEFVGKDQAGNSVQLSDYRGKKVVLYFYPKDNTEACTKQACSLRDNHSALQQAGYVVLGVSTDDEKSHQKFIEKQNLPFTLLADTDHSIHDLYGTWQEKTMYGKKYMGTVRTTFLIDENGKISDIITKVKTAEHAAQILS